ncbi:N-acetyltransferase [Actinoalloteichus sp. AHMU CJ021]|uniref:N-acetyltransferase n=1 Tax=Actinoalloteichus caeruleus DSM 43889 TaxID=1120930 RepID=A0ABT1JGH6_ACTCY|nr:hypothetical protein [Actinoalloteichus caeruleus]AUS79714.1 N-acetyltransferase [Actinoalloteichus sp. AHMU CJ021]MCP2331615.1 hypothetical protein [Actinoalloteichus caeruleus DSM 43889]
MDLRTVTMVERPDLENELWELDSGWPAFIDHDPVTALLDLAVDRFPEFQLVVLDGDEVVAKVHSVPFHWSDRDPDELGPGGWDWVLTTAFLQDREGITPNAVSALEISVRIDLQGRGLAARVLALLADNCRRLRFGDLVAPVRPTHKHQRPRQPMGEYARETRDDGLPADPWLRVHARAGGRLLRPCPASMTIAGSLEQWREWTDLPLTSSGPVEVPGALVPVVVDVDADHAVYVEPNVWVHHALDQR